MGQISIIIPALNEQDVILPNILALQDLRKNGHEIILVDGGSTDSTRDLVQPFVDKIVCSTRGRAKQMNKGAKLAKGNLLWFLHADTHAGFYVRRRMEALSEQRADGWGRFDIRLSGSKFAFRIIEFLMNWRSALTGVATGDQGIFISKSLFNRMGGFPDIALMEDIALSGLLRKQCKPQRYKETLVTSSRYWEQNGVFYTITKMWWLRALYSLGWDPNQLLHRYYDSR